LFCSMAAKLAKAPKKRLEEARNDCVRFARAIIARWPRDTTRHENSATRKKSPYDEFAEHLLTLHDRDTIAMFLTKLAEKDQSLRLSAFILNACREFGWSAFAQELKHLISSRPNKHGRQEIPFRDVQWLSAFSCDTTSDPEKSALANELCALAVERFCEPPQPQPTYNSTNLRREASISEKSLPWLLKALSASGSDEGLSHVINFVQESPDEFSLDDCQVPCLKSLIPWSLRQFDLVHPQLASWLVSVRQHLESATARQPVAPTDWARPADFACNCQFCAQLKAFLADPANEVGRIPAREDARQHLIGIIGRHRCDVKHALERTGSPYSLVLTKTTGSFQQAVKRFEANRKLLSELPVLDDTEQPIA